jgi:outer membrane immunogenic protein
MQRLPVVCAALVIALASPAVAADMPVKAIAPVPTFNWSGFYLGAEGGGAWGNSQYIYDEFGSAAVTPKFAVSGALFGGTAGFNYQINHLVLGLEGDLSWADIKGSAHDLPPRVGINSDPLINSNTNQHWLDTARGRLGWAADRWLVYATGGVAVTSVEAFIDASAVVPPAVSPDITQTRSTWTAGAGIEYAFAGPWSAKLEYLYMDFGKQSLFPTGEFLDYAGRSLSLSENVVRVGVNYRFNSGSPVGSGF